MYIQTFTLQYPVSQQQIQANYPNTSFPTPFVPPAEYSYVFPTPVPSYDVITEGYRELPPVFIDPNWTQVWEVYGLTQEQIDANIAAKQVSDLAMVRSQCQALIVATYPEFIQSNCSLGLYNDEFTTQMKANIVLAVNESNRCEDLINDNLPFTPNWPVFTIVYPFLHMRHPPYPA